MTRLSFTDFDEFFDAVRGVQGRYLPTTRSIRAWQLRVLELGSANIMLGQSGSAAVCHLVAKAEHVSLMFPLSKPGAMFVDGNPLTRETLAWYTPERAFEYRTLAPLRWAGINLHLDMVRSRLDFDDPVMPALLDRNRICVVERTHIAELLALARRAFRVDTLDPRALDPAGAREILSHQLLEAALRCLSLEEADGPLTRGRPRVDRRAILDRAIGVIEQRMHKSLYIEELCRAVRVSPRTLHTVFVDYYGITPHRYLALRRLSSIRDALRSAEPDETVQSICTRFGVWDFGRFSGQYKRHFGAMPSQQLGSRWR